MIPHVLKNFNLFVNGQGYAGLVEEAELPEVKIKTEGYRGGGMDIEYELDMGMEGMTSKLTMKEFNPALIATINSGSRFQLRGAMVRDTDNDTVALVVEMIGRQKTFTSGSLKAGDPNKPEHEFTVDYYRLNIGGVDLIEIDVINAVRVINGIDQLADMRAALAI